MKTTKTDGQRQGYGYGRFSDKPQERGDSYRRQTQFIKTASERDGVHILKVFFDEAVSGKDGLNLERQFGEMLKVLQSGQVVYVDSQERLGRQNPFLLGSLILDTVNRGVEMRFEDGTNINQENMGNLATQFNVFTKGALGSYEIKERGRKIRQSWIGKTEAIFKDNKPMPKYQPCWIGYDKKKEQYTYDEDKIATIQYIFRLASGKLGLLKLCNRLNDEKVPVVSTRKNTKHWSRTTINIILKNKAVYGCYVAKDGREKEDHYRVIVDKDTFYTVQENLDSRFKGGGGRPSTRPNPYKGLCKCQCGANLMYVTKRKKNNPKIWTTLCCHSKIIGVCKPYESIKYNMFDTSFRYQFLNDPDIILKAFEKNTPKETKSKALEGELTTIKTRLHKYQSDLEEGTIQLTATLDSVLANLENRVKTLTSDLELQRAKEAEANRLPTMLRGYFKTQSNTFLVDNTPKPEWSNDTLKSFIERIDIDLKARQFTVQLKDAKSTRLLYPFLEAKQ